MVYQEYRCRKGCQGLHYIYGHIKLTQKWKITCNHGYIPFNLLISDITKSISISNNYLRNEIMNWYLDCDQNSDLLVSSKLSRFIEKYCVRKELTLCNKLWFSNPYVFGFQRRKPLKFQTMTFIRSKNISLKYQRFSTLGSKNIGIRKSEFVAKSQFLFKVFKKTKVSIYLYI